MKYIRKFETSEEYNEALGVGIPTPNVCYVEESKGVSYNPYVPSPYDCITNSNGKIVVTLQVVGINGSSPSIEGAALYQYMVETNYLVDAMGMHWRPNKGEEFRINGTGSHNVVLDNCLVTYAYRLPAGGSFVLVWEGLKGGYTAMLDNDGTVKAWDDDY